MAEYGNENRGAIWKNNKKETEKHPDFTGELDVNGVKYWVSAWKRKEGASEKAPALSFQIKPKESKPDEFKQEADKHFTKKPASDGFDEDIPW